MEGIPNSESPRTARVREARKIETFSDLLKHLHIKSDEWDVILIGDGSGSTPDRPIGWATVIIEKGKLERETLSGSMSCGTNNVAELMAVLHPLTALTRRQKGVRSGGLRVHVITDSEYVVRGLRQLEPTWAHQLKVNRELWMAVHMTRRKGMVITPHHIPRDSVELQKLGHNLANAARKANAALEVSQDVQEANPD